MNGEETGHKTLGFTCLNDETLFSSWTDKIPILVCTVCKYVQILVTRHSFNKPSFYRSEKRLLIKLSIIYQGHSTTKSSSITAFLHKALFANETTRLNVENLFFEYHAGARGQYQRKKKLRRGHKKWRQQRLIRLVDKFLASTAPESNIRPVVGHNVIPTRRVLQTRTNQGTTVADVPYSATASLYEEFIVSVWWSQKFHRRVLYVGATLPSLKLISTSPRNAKLGLRNKSVASSSSGTGFFDKVQRKILSIECTAEVFFRRRSFAWWGTQWEKAFGILLLRDVNRHLSVFGFLQAAMIPAHHQSYFFF